MGSADQDIQALRESQHPARRQAEPLRDYPMSVLESPAIESCAHPAAAPAALARVLVIDDEEIVGNALSAMLRAEGFEAVIARSGEEGADLLRGQPFEVAITDLVMPGMNGLQVLATLKEIDPDIEVIILSGRATVTSTIAALRLGACDFLLKPIGAAQIRPAVLKALKKRDGEIARAEGRARAVIETSQEVIVLLDKEGIARDFNPQAEKVFGWSREQAVGRNLADFAISPEYRNTFRSHLERAHREGKAPRNACLEVCAIRQNGEEFPFEISTAVIRTPRGRLLSTFGRDVTKRKQAEEALVKAEEHFRSLFTSIPLPTFFFDAETLQYFDVNDAAAAYSGYSREELLMMRVTDLVLPETAPFVVSRIKARPINSRAREQGRHRLKDGRVVDVEVDACTLHFHGRRATIAVVQDVTERKRAEEALRESEERFRSLAASAHDAIVLLDDKGIVFYWNEAAEKIFGYSSQEVLGKEAHMVLAPERYLEAYRSGFAHFQQSGQGMVIGNRVELFAVRKGGDEFPVELSVSAVRIRNKLATLGILRDITERKRAEAEMAERHRLATLVAETGMVLTRAEDLRQGLQQCAEILVRTTGVAFTRIWIVNEDENILELHASAGLYTHLDGGHARVPVGKFKIGSIAQSGEPYMTNNILEQAWLKDPGWARREGIVAFASYPLKINERVIGVVAAFARQSLTNATLQAFASVADNLAQFIERERTERALRDNEEKYRVLYESSRDAIMTLAPPTWQFTAGNPAAIALFAARDEQEFVTASPWSLSPERQPDGEISSAKVSRMIATAMEKGSHFFEWTHKKFSGQEFLATVALTRMICGGQTLLQATVKDITAKKQAEQQTRLQTAALKSAHNGIVITDREGHIIWANPAFSRLTGYPIEEVLGQTPRALKSGKQPASFYQELWQTILAGKVWQGELVNRRKDGVLYTEEMTITPVRDRRGAIARFIAIKQDITERKRAEEMRQAKEAAEAATRVKSQFLANMSHEIRTPLNGVIGMTKVLMDTELSAEQHQYAKVACTCGEALLALINNILDFSKIEAGELSLEVTDFDLHKMLEQTIEILATHARKKGLELTCQVAPGTPSLVRGDPVRLRQILLNLAGNAVKFTPQGKVEIQVGVDQEGENAVTLRFTVEDTGIGIPKDRGDTLFSPFVQADSSTTRKYGGTGLGLAISRQLLELMGGQIGMESEEGKGSTFWFTVVQQKQKVRSIPGAEQSSERDDDARAPALDEKDPGNQSTCSKGPDPLASPPDRAGARILVAEDVESNRQVVRAILGKLGYHIDLVANGAEALAALQSAPYDLILMDCEMPEMDGYEATRRIRKQETIKKKARIPILALTAHAVCGDQAKCQEAGMDDYVSKPVEPQKLVEAMGKWLRPSPPPGKPAARGNEQAQSTAGVFNEAELLERLMGDRALAGKIVAGFLQDTPAQLRLLRERLEAGDAEESRRRAHALKGAAATVSAASLRNAALQVEEAARAGDLGQAGELLSVLDETFAQLHSALREAHWA